jgi:SRSO17 transposase
LLCAQITAAVEQGVPVAMVLADAAYGNASKFRNGLEALGVQYVLGIQSTTTVWPEGSAPLAPHPYRGCGRPPKLLRRAAAAGNESMAGRRPRPAASESYQ